MQEDWKQLLKERMDKAECPAPEGLLSDVKEEMERREKVSRRPVVWLWTRRLAVAAAVVAVCGIAIWREFPSSPSQPLSDRTVSSPSPKANSQRGNHQTGNCPSNNAGQYGSSAVFSAMEASTEKKPAAKAPAVNAFAANTPAVNALAANAPMENVSAVDASSAPMLRTMKALTDSVQEKSLPTDNLLAAEHPQTSVHKDSYMEDNDPFYARMSAAAREAEEAPLLVEARVGGAALSSLSTSSSPVFASASPTDGVYYDAENREGTATDKLQDALMANGMAEKEAHHHQPLRVGLSLSIPLTNHWSLTTGLTGTRLTSDFTATGVNWQQDDHQRLYYLGLPVRMNYVLWQNRSWRAYLSAGGAVEQLVKGTVTTTVTDSKGQQTSLGDERVHEHRPQFSVGAAAGLSFSFLKNLSFYVEPGVSYYIHNGSSVDNIYKDQPTQFQLDLGIRYRIR
ncbi:MAG: outer membrane beta-barrel protein [Prevotella sp.]|nr:outer membrane beta-barrel protein [Prevotella sp.]